MFVYLPTTLSSLVDSSFFHDHGVTSNSKILNIHPPIHANNGSNTLSSSTTYLHSYACFTNKSHTTRYNKNTKKGIINNHIHGVSRNKIAKGIETKKITHHHNDCLRWKYSYGVTDSFDKAATIHTKKYINTDFFVSTVLGTYWSSIRPSSCLSSSTMAYSK